MFNNPLQNEMKGFLRGEDASTKTDDLEIPQNGIPVFLELQDLSSEYLIIEEGKEIT